MNIVLSTKNIMLGNISGIHRGFFEHPALDFAKRDQSASFLEVAEIGNCSFKQRKLCFDYFLFELFGDMTRNAE